MARDMALAGVDRSTLTSPDPIEQPKTLGGKWKNFWYHHKPFVIVGAFLLAVGAWMLYQTLSADPPDYKVVVVTEEALYHTEIGGIELYLASCGEDLDGDGKIEVEVENLLPGYYSNQTPPGGTADAQKLISYLSVGENMLFVFDDVSYRGFNQTVESVTDEDYQFFAPLDTAADGYDADEHYWNWMGDSRIEQYGLSKLPDDLYFGVRTPEGTASDKKSVAAFEQGSALLVKLSETAS